MAHSTSTVSPHTDDRASSGTKRAGKNVFTGATRKDLGQRFICYTLTMMTGNCDDGRQRTPVGSVELVADVWFMIMSLLSTSDVVRLSHVSDPVVTIDMG